MRKQLLIAAVLVGSTAMVGCKGEIALHSDNPGDGLKINEPVDPAENNFNLPPANNVTAETCADADTALGQTPLRRLTAVEYNNTVRDLLPGIAVPTQNFSADEEIGGFSANVVAPLGELQTDEYQRAAEAVAAAAIADGDTLFANCQNRDEACADMFIDSFGRQAYRRDLETTERERMKALWSFGNTEYDFETGIRLLIEGTLQSPSFLYRVEVGSADMVSALDNFEIASRMSYFLWKSTPDTQLLDLAAAGQLSEPATIEEQARRMIADPKSRNAINEVVLQWFGVDNFEDVEKMDEDFTPEMQESMRNETLAFVDHVLWEDDGRLETLLTANYTFVDANTAALYGVNAGAEDGMVRVDLDAAQRKGILTHPSVLARHGFGSMSVHRGKFVREALFCATPPAPPQVLENPPDTFEGQAERDKAQDRLDHSGCGGCHTLMDPIGLAFDNYDGMGRWRTQDEFGNDVYGDGNLFATDIDGDLTGAADLAQKMVESEQVASCVSQQFFRYAFARNALREDVCSVQAMEDALARSNGDIKEMLVAMATTDAFRYRRNQ